MATKSQKLWYCLTGNVVITAYAVILIFALNDGSSKYFRFGPNDDLMLITVKVDTWTKWSLAIVCIGILRVGALWVNEIGSPILGFNIYNPDKIHITDFSKNELNFLANGMWSINAIRGVFMTVIAITQIDLAFASVLVSEFACIFTIRWLLNEKTFGTTELEEIVLNNNTGHTNGAYQSFG